MKRLNVLVSYGTMGKGVLDALRPDWDVLLDSGAFTNFGAGKDVVTLESYAGFLEEHGAKFWRYFNLDRIGDPEVSQQNFEKLRARGLRPVPVFQRAAPIQDFFAMGEQSDLVAIGGVATKGRTGKVEFLDRITTLAREKGIYLHLLGVGSYNKFLSRFRPYSSDCSDHVDLGRYGNARIWDPKTRLDVRISNTRGRPLTAKTCGFARLLALYGVSLKDIGDSKWWGKEEARRMTTLSRFFLIEHLERLGTKYFIACTDVEELGKWWASHAKAKAA